MESEVNQPEVPTKSDILKVTPISKYLAMILFILLLFIIGSWVAYIYAPDRTLDTEEVVHNKIDQPEIITEDNGVQNNYQNEDPSDTNSGISRSKKYLSNTEIDQYVSISKYQSEELGFYFSYPKSWGEPKIAWELGDSISNSASYRILFPDLKPEAPGLAMLAGSRSLTVEPLGRGPSFGDLFTGVSNMEVVCNSSDRCTSYKNSNGVTIWRFDDYLYGYDERADFYVFNPVNGFFGPVIISSERLDSVVSNSETISETIETILDSVKIITNNS